MGDNVSAVAYINNMGGCKSTCCNIIEHDIWEWILIKKLWLSAAHILGLHNVIEDCESRKFRDASKWMHCNIRGKPEVDLSTRRLHSKLTNYFS